MKRRQFFHRAGVLGVGSTISLLCSAQDSKTKSPSDSLVNSDTDEAIQNGLNFLCNSQSNDGSFGDRNGFGNVAVTALAGLALLAGGHAPGRGKYGKTVSRCVDYVLARGRAGKSGYLQNTDVFPSHGAMYQHGFGALFLSEVCGTLPDPARQQKVREMLEKAISLTVKAQNREGGWRYDPSPNAADVSVTVAHLMALRAAKNAGIFIDKSVVDKCVEYIKGCKMSDGGYCYQKGQPATGSQFPRSAAAVVGLFSAGIYAGEDYKKYIEPGLRYLLRSLPRGGGRAFNLRQDHYFYGQYYAALAMWTAGDEYWGQWFPAIRDELLANRNKDRVWDDMHGSAYATAMACIILQLPNNYLPIMQK